MWYVVAMTTSTTSEATTMNITTSTPLADGTIQYRANRVTGTMIAVIDCQQDTTGTFCEDDGGRWVTLCEDHETLVQHDRKTDAIAFAAHPDEWCGVCARIASGEHDDTLTTN